MSAEILNLTDLTHLSTKCIRIIPKQGNLHLDFFVLAITSVIQTMSSTRFRELAVIEQDRYCDYLDCRIREAARGTEIFAVPLP